jgi:Cdc6-like AAA superfamily ATPase
MNPFDPQRPTPPEAFAGRAGRLERVAVAVAAPREQRAGSAILVHGHRGSGKTLALREIESHLLAATPDSVVIEVPLNELSSESDLL